MPEAGLVISHLFAGPSRAGRRLADSAGRWSLRGPAWPAWLDARGKRLTFHWNLGPVEADFKPAFRRSGLDRFLAETGVDLFSFDLGPAARRRVGFLPVSRPLGPAGIRRHTEAALRMIRRHYRGPLAAENYNHYPTGLYGPVAEPDFIQGYLSEFDLGLVLDLAHARVTAHNLGLVLADYLEALPLERTEELHLSRPWLPPAGSRRQPSLWAADAHGAPQEEEWNLVADILKNKRLPGHIPVFIEYYDQLAKLEQSQNRLRSLCGQVGVYP